MTTLEPARSTREELRQTARLAAPLALAFAGTQLMSLVDMLVAGAIGESTLAAAGLGQSAFFLATVAPVGLLMGLDPLVSQALGRGAHGDAHRAHRSGLAIAARITLPVMGLALMLAGAALWLSSVGPHTRTETWAYTATRALGVGPLLVFTAHRCLLQGWGRPAPIAGAILLGNAVNLPLSALLGAGDGALALVGLPPVGLGDGLGAAGIGLASTLVAVAQAAALQMAARRLPGRPTRGERPALKPLIDIGWPIGLQLTAAAGAFCGLTFAMGAFGEAAIAAHQIALTVTAMTFTACLGIGSATAVRVGHAVGAGRVLAARRVALVGLGLGTGLMLASAAGLTLGGDAIARWFVAPGPALDLATELLAIAAVFQVFDGIQTIAGGALRGAGDTRAAMRLGVVGYWLVGAPLAVGLAFAADLGPRGLWHGLVAGLAFAAIALTARLLMLTTDGRAERRASTC